MKIAFIERSDRNASGNRIKGHCRAIWCLCPASRAHQQQ
jgi:hypothetical protein